MSSSHYATPTTADIVCCETLRVAGDLLVPAVPTFEASTFIQQLLRRMDELKSTPSARHATSATFVHKDLRDLNNVFLRQHARRRDLEPPYIGPQKVIIRTGKTLTIVVSIWQVNITAERIKTPSAQQTSPPANQ